MAILKRRWNSRRKPRIGGGLGDGVLIDAVQAHHGVQNQEAGPDALDALSRLSPAIDVRPHYRGTDVVETLERVTGTHGTPKTIRLDNGPEFISKSLDLRAWLNGVTLDFSRPGKSTDNAFVESFNGSFRAECLNASWFLSLADARAKC